MKIPFEKVISVIHHPKFSGLPTHYPSLAAWNTGNFDVLKVWNNYYPQKEKIGIYINVPFCKTRCSFCFLDIILDKEQMQDLYLNYLISEFKLLSRNIHFVDIDSVYIGGGTPNILSTKNLEKLLENLYIFFNLKKCKQISIESNPDFWNETKIKILKNYGVGLVSIGIQSFENSISLANNRFQKLKNIEKIIFMMKKNNIKINIDILAGISDEKVFFEDIDNVVKLLPDQVHINRLKPIGRKFKEGEKEYLVALQNKSFQLLQQKGYVRLDEDSAGLGGFTGNIQGNPDFQIYSSIIACGLMSIGHIYKKMRYQNVYDFKSYISCLRKGCLPIMRYSAVKEEDEITHYCLNKILRDGVHVKDLSKKFNTKAVKFIVKKMSDMKKKGILKFENSFYKAGNDRNWYEITKSLYAVKYLYKIAERYKLIQ